MPHFHHVNVACHNHVYIIILCISQYLKTNPNMQAIHLYSSIQIITQYLKQF